MYIIYIFKIFDKLDSILNKTLSNDTTYLWDSLYEIYTHIRMLPWNHK